MPGSITSWPYEATLPWTTGGRATTVWDDGPNGSFDSVAYKTMLEENVRKPGKLERNEGDVDAALASASKVISAEYYSPHLAHATMEPPAATARRTGPVVVHPTKRGCVCAFLAPRAEHPNTEAWGRRKDVKVFGCSDDCARCGTAKADRMRTNA
jgi:hypothetical protein